MIAIRVNFPVHCHSTIKTTTITTTAKWTLKITLDPFSSMVKQVDQQYKQYETQTDKLIVISTIIKMITD